jgi:uncharacterized protein
MHSHRLYVETRQPLHGVNKYRASAQQKTPLHNLLTFRTSMSTPELPEASPAASRAESLIEYPSKFPIKVMGTKVEGLVHAITSITLQFDPEFDAATIELRESKGGKYLGITVTVNATSREQLDELYRTLSTHPMVKVVL